MRYIQSFSASGMVQEALDNELLGKPYVAYVEDEHRLDWNARSRTLPLSAQPLTIEIISGGTITWLKGYDSIGPAPERTINYSINNSAWSSITSTSEGASFVVNDGDIVRFKGNNSSYQGSLGRSGNQLIVDGVFKIYGNLNSLYVENYTDISDCVGVAFLFAGNTGLTEVVDMSIGNNNVNHLNEAYALRSLFQGCSNLASIKTLIKGTVLDSSNIKNWVNGVAANGTFVKNSAQSYSTGVNGIPDGWTVIDA